MESYSRRQMRPSVMVSLFITAAVLIGVVLGLLAYQVLGTDNEQTDTANHEVLEHDHGDPVRTDPEVAAKAAMVAVFSYDPATQDTTFDQLATVRDRLTGTLGQLADHPPSGQQAQAQLPPEWDSWASSGDEVRGFATLAPGSPTVGENDTTATVTVDVEQKVIHPDGDTTPYEQFVADVAMVHEGGGWKAADYQITGIN